MKKLGLALALILGLAGSASAAENCSQNVLPVCVAFDNQSASGVSQVIDTGGMREIASQIWSTSGSVAVVNIECRSIVQTPSGANAPWFPCAVIANPDNVTGAYLSLPRSHFYRGNIVGAQYSSGAINMTFERYQQ